MEVIEQPAGIVVVHVRLCVYNEVVPFLGLRSEVRAKAKS